MRKLDVLSLDGEGGERPAPVMPSACETSGCGGPEPEPSEPIEIGGEVSVAGKPIAEAAIAAEMQHHPAASAEEAWLSAARALAVRELLALEAGADSDDPEAAIGALLEDAITPVRPSEEECRRAYDADPSRFVSPALTEAGHVLIEPEEDTRGGWHRAHEIAERLIGEIDGDPQAFAAAAREYSGCPSGKQDGSLGQLRAGELAEEIEQALAELEEGDIGVKPVRSRHGWHILHVHRRIPGRTLPFEVVRDKIGEMLEARSWTMQAARYVASLAEKYPVRGIDLVKVSS